MIGAGSGASCAGKGPSAPRAWGRRHRFAGVHVPAGKDVVSERTTWETCPHCGLTAAVGWLDGVPAEFDCTAGLAPTAQDLGRLGRAAGGWSSPARRVDATWRSR